MQIYELLVSNKPTFERPNSGHFKLPISPSAKKTTWLPNVYCKACGGRPGSLGYPIPEAEDLPDEGEILAAIVKMHRQIDRVRRKISYNMIAGIKDDSISDDIDGSISPKEFQTLASALCDFLKIPPQRKIWPLSRIGILNVICNSPSIPDFCEVSSGSPPVVSSRAKSAFEESKFNGWHTFPVKVAMANIKKLRESEPPELWEILVIGDGGIPAGLSKGTDYEECRECGFITWHGRLDTVSLDMSQWDGSDIFHFTDMGGIYVTEDYKKAVEAAELTGAYFRPSHMTYTEWESRIISAL
ncbi:MAG TPA: hypothetical protein VF600_01135 [Abditibacteriaceae bacterium]